MPTHSLFLTNSIPTYVYKNSVVIQGQGQQNVVTQIGIPSAPIFSTLAGNGFITLNFTPGDLIEIPLITDYQYSLDGGITFNTMNSIDYTQPYTISGLTNGQIYQVQMIALNADGYGTASASQQVIPSTTALAPTITSVTGDNGKALVYFTAPTDNGGATITNYAISTDNGISFFYYIFPQITSPLTITNLTNGNNYPIVIKAMNDNGFGLPSNSISVTLLVPPAILSSATNYFKFANSFDNEISGSGLTLNVFQNSTLSVLNSKSCVAFSNNGYLISNALTSLPTLFSICYWVYNVTGNDLPFSISNGTSNGNVFTETLASTAMIYNVANINSFYTGNYTYNQWNFIVHTINATGGASSQLGLYINGTNYGLVGNTGTGFYPSFSFYYYYFAKDTTSTLKLNGGGIRHFMTFNKILTQTEVTNIMNYTT